MGRLYRDAGKIVLVLPAKDLPLSAAVPHLRYAAARSRRPRRKEPAASPPARPDHPMDSFILWYGQHRRISYWWAFTGRQLARMLPI